MQDDSQRLRIFISYARADGSTLAEELSIGLELLGFVAVLDKRDIAAAEDWELRLESLVRQADTVVFVLSPKSVASPRCAWEVEKAIALSKRIVPVVAAAVPETEVPPPLRKLNFIDFGPGQSFARALGKLGDALRVDLDWIREHTRLGELAARWIARGRDEALLLRGAELAGGQAWATRWHAGAPEITTNLRAYLTASAEASGRRESLERQRLDELAKAVASQAEALAQREAATKRLRRRTVAAGMVGTALTAGLGALGFLFLREARELETARQRADAAATLALKEAAHREAMRTDLEGQVVVYSATPGQVGDDAAGFSKNLLAEMTSEQVSLGQALSRTVKKVLEKTKGHQRPYISSDLNGDVYLRMSPPSRRRRALLVTVDHVFRSTALPGVRIDGQAWNDFLQSAGFEVQWLRNPKREDVMGALRSVQLSTVDIPPSMFRRAGVSKPPAKTGTREAIASPTLASPSPNSFYLLYYAGPSFGDAGQRYLLMDDSPGTKSGVDGAELRRTALAVDELTALLRQRFAASCLVLDV